MSESLLATLISTIFPSIIWGGIALFIVFQIRRMVHENETNRKEIELRRIRELEYSKDRDRMEDKETRNSLSRIMHNLETMNSYQQSIERSRQQEQGEIQRAIQSLNSLSEHLSSKIGSIPRHSELSEVSNP